MEQQLVDYCAQTFHSRLLITEAEWMQLHDTIILVDSGGGGALHPWISLPGLQKPGMERRRKGQCREMEAEEAGQLASSIKRPDNKLRSSFPRHTETEETDQSGWSPAPTRGPSNIPACHSDFHGSRPSCFGNGRENFDHPAGRVDWVPFRSFYPDSGIDVSVLGRSNHRQVTSGLVTLVWVTPSLDAFSQSTRVTRRVCRWSNNHNWFVHQSDFPVIKEFEKRNENQSSDRL